MELLSLVKKEREFGAIRALGKPFEALPTVINCTKNEGTPLRRRRRLARAEPKSQCALHVWYTCHTATESATRGGYAKSPAVPGRAA
jgi:hypothetical protein